MNLSDINKTTGHNPTKTFPVLFIGHGNPMNAIQDNDFTHMLTMWGKQFQERPKAILVYSAHWLTRGIHVTVTEKPETIHDFGGFPPELYKIQYPAPGASHEAREVKAMASSVEIKEDPLRGLDHGAWTILRHLYAEADIPVFQLSIDYYKPLSYHFELARELYTLRNKGVLVIGSGNIVHNLHQADFNNKAPYDWAIEFNDMVKSQILKGDFRSLIDLENLSSSSQLAVPTPDHYIPMLFSLGLSDKGEKTEIIFDEIQHASVGMLSFQIG